MLAIMRSEQQPAQPHEDSPQLSGRAHAGSAAHLEVKVIALCAQVGRREAECIPQPCGILHPQAVAVKVDLHTHCTSGTQLVSSPLAVKGHGNAEQPEGS